MSTNNFTVTEDHAGERLDKFLAAQTGLSRSYVQKLVSDHARKVKVGEVINIEIPEAKALDLTPYDFPLDVVYEDKELLVLNKPAGLTVHPADGNWEKTLVHALLHHCKGQLSGINGVERPGIVHRLDKDTSGLMVVAKTDEAHKRLAAQIEAREIKRTYLALVHGFPNPPTGLIRTGYGRHPRDRKKMTTFDLTEAVYSTGGSSRKADFNTAGEIMVGSTTEFGMERGGGRGAKIAITEYRVVEIFGEGKYSLVECKLQTGRTHQIRVHMKHLKCPIVGDPVYGNARLDNVLKAALAEAQPKRKSKKTPVKDSSFINRQALHAYKLEIPNVGAFEAEIADDMKGLINSISMGS